MSPPCPASPCRARGWRSRLQLAVLALPAALPALVLTGSPASATVPAGTLQFVAGTGTAGAPVPGPAASSPLGYDYAVAVDAAGNVFMADDSGYVEKVTPAGVLSVLAGTGTQGSPVPGPAVDSPLNRPDGLAVDGAGNLYVADYAARVVVKITAGGTLSILAGTGTSGAPVPGPATSSPLGSPWQVAADPAGDVYIADTDNGLVEKVTAAGELSVVAGNGTSGAPVAGPALSSPVTPQGLEVDGAGNLYVSTGSQVVKISPAGELAVVAGNGTSGAAVAGPALDSPLANPDGLALDAAGNLYVALYGDINQVAEVSPGGALSIVAGSGPDGPAAEGPAVDSPLSYPTDVAVDRTGNVYIADSGNTRIERVTQPGPSSGPIAEKYASLGGSSSLLGATVGAEADVPGGRAQRYEGGAIYWSNGTGAHEVHGSNLLTYRATGETAGGLGFPTTDEVDGARRGRLNHFAGGGIYWTPATGSHEVHGSIGARYVELGAEAGLLGYPVTDESPTAGFAGRYNGFTGGSVHWTAATGAHETHGAIRAHWAELGWERGLLSYPVTDEAGTPDGVSRYNHFLGGSVYWTPGTGAHEVHGAIRQAWAAAGWETGRLGYPVSDEYAVPGGRRSDFTRGSLTFSSRDGSVTATLR